MRTSTAYSFFNGVHTMQQQQAKLAATQEQVASGKKINRPSDDPSGAYQVSVLNQGIKQLDQFKDNANSALFQLQQVETEISSNIDILQRTRQLAVAMSTDTMSPDNRRQAAAEVDQLLNGLLNHMNATNLDGQFLFAGDNTDDRPFVEDPTNPGFVTYLTDPARPDNDPRAAFGHRSVQINFDDNLPVQPEPSQNPSRVRIAEVGSEVFGAGLASTSFASTDAEGVDHNIYNVVKIMRDRLEAGERPGDDILDDLKNAIDQQAATLTSVGTRVNRIDAQLEVNEIYKIAMTERRSGFEDLDLAEGITKLNLTQTALQVSQQTFARVQQLSLFNFINTR
ncbi:flagellar hook-associated protein FlgL [Thiomicrospira sp. ALE5]|uniref:flagellar hook-associated protein FlgL n=1 Tax=Thiomicrospira sp. ALE5 TaxID=748650 RepID=UPI0008E8A25D|nr:flagellar hook-associated protein FlgL [Thiomicrospira sp. ALE5]SFR59492.1 flagellar hook-associated protein 3 FlgL [Thiomicrospira sp. ALE5]